MNLSTVQVSPMVLKCVDVIERVPAWLPKIGGMTIEQLSTYEVLLHRVPRTCAGEIRAKVVDELGWTEEPSHVVSMALLSTSLPKTPMIRMPLICE